MNAVTYSRFSSDLQRESSIVDQQRNCAAYAQREGLIIGKQYADKALSGKLNGNGRPEYSAMLKAAQAGEFQVLIVDDLSRLSRDDVELKILIRRFKHWNVRLIGVSDGFDSNTKGYKIHAGLKGLMNELFLDDLRAKTRRGLEGRVLAGYNAGSRTYGYRHEPVYDPTKHDADGQRVLIGKRKVINPEQSKIIKRIFQRYAAGDSPRHIADTLNKDGVKASKGNKWVVSSIVQIIGNQTYIGKVIWGKTTSSVDPDSQKVKRIKSTETVTADRPDLRIISDDLWNAVMSRKERQRMASQAVQGKLHKNARTGRGPKFLLSGLLVCSECGSNYVARDQVYFGCGGYMKGGPSACSNNVKVKRDVATNRILEALKSDLFRPEMLAMIKTATERKLKEAKRIQTPERDNLKRELAAVSARISNLVSAVAENGYSPALKAALGDAERTRDQIDERLKVNHKGLDLLAEFLPSFNERVTAALNSLDKTLQADVNQSRQALKTLFGGPIKLFRRESDLLLEAELSPSYGGLINLAAPSLINDCHPCL